MRRFFQWRHQVSDSIENWKKNTENNRNVDAKSLPQVN
jgi:hypothetical protein